jgi:inorganic pyrophosphatase/exopolyphosphatase
MIFSTWKEIKDAEIYKLIDHHRKVMEEVIHKNGSFVKHL